MKGIHKPHCHRCFLPLNAKLLRESMSSPSLRNIFQETTKYSLSRAFQKHGIKTEIFFVAVTAIAFSKESPLLERVSIAVVYAHLVDLLTIRRDILEKHNTRVTKIYQSPIKRQFAAIPSWLNGIDPAGNSLDTIF